MTKMQDEITPVVGNRSLTGGHYLLSLYSPRQARATRPGQFAMVRLPGRSDVLLRRPMSIYEVAQRSKHSKPEIIRLLYKIVGRGTRMMAELKPADRVGLIAPLGHGFFEEEYLARALEADEVLLVAGGIGIAALLMPARELAGRGIRATLFFGGRTKNDLAGLADFRRSIRTAVLSTEDGSRGHRGYVTEPLADYLHHHSKKRFLLMVCGPWPMLAASVALVQRYGHPCLVSMENRMGCGLGVCLGCSIRVDGTGHGAYERVCTEGPVFWAEKVAWNAEAPPKV